MSTESPDVVIAKRLLDHLRLRGFQFRRTSPGPDAALIGTRATEVWSDTIKIDGFSRGCQAWRIRTSSLILPGEALVELRVQGSALTVMNEVLAWDTA